MKTFEIYFQTTLQQTLWGEDPDPGDYCLIEEEYQQLLNRKLRFRYLEKGKDFITFECWLSFKAKTGEEAVKKVNNVLEKNDFDWVDIWVLLENEKVLWEHL